MRADFGDSSGDKRNYRVNFDKINKQLPGFKCDWDVVAGARSCSRSSSRSDMTRSCSSSAAHPHQADQAPARHRTRSTTGSSGRSGRTARDLRPRRDRRRLPGVEWSRAATSAASSRARGVRRSSPRTASRCRTGPNVQTNLSFNSRHDPRPALPGRARTGRRSCPLHRGRGLRRHRRPCGPGRRPTAAVAGRRPARRQPTPALIPDRLRARLPGAGRTAEVSYQVSHLLRPAPSAASAGTTPPSASTGRSASRSCRTRTVLAGLRPARGARDPGRSSALERRAAEATR